MKKPIKNNHLVEVIGGVDVEGPSNLRPYIALAGKPGALRVPWLGGVLDPTDPRGAPTNPTNPRDPIATPL